MFARFQFLVNRVRRDRNSLDFLELHMNGRIRMHGAAVGLLGFLVVTVCGCDEQPTSLPAAIRAKLRDIENGDGPGVARPMLPHVDPTPTFSIPMREEWTMEQAVADALRRIGAAAVPAVVQTLQSPDPETRKRAVDLLGRMGPSAKEAVPDLIEALADRDPQVRKMAVRALGQIGPAAAAAIPALIRVWEEEDSSAG